MLVQKLAVLGMLYHKAVLVCITANEHRELHVLADFTLAFLVAFGDIIGVELFHFGHDLRRILFFICLQKQILRVLNVVNCEGQIVRHLSIQGVEDLLATLTRLVLHVAH